MIRLEMSNILEKYIPEMLHRPCDGYSAEHGYLYRSTFNFKSEKHHETQQRKIEHKDIPGIHLKYIFLSLYHFFF